MAMVKKKKRRKCSDVAVKQGIQGRGKPAAGVDNYLVGWSRNENQAKLGKLNNGWWRLVCICSRFVSAKKQENEVGFREQPGRRVDGMLGLQGSVSGVFQGCCKLSLSGRLVALAL